MKMKNQKQQKLRGVSILLMCVLLMSSLFVPGALADGAYGGGDYAIVKNPNPQDRLNLRVSPNANSGSLGKYYNGVSVYITGYWDNDWAMVEIGSGEGKATGYMMTKFLVINGASYVASAIPTLYTKRTASLYTRTSTNATVLANYGEGTAVEILAVASSWYHVRIGNSIGYMRGYDFEGSAPEPDSSSGSGSSSGGDSWTGIGTGAFINYAVVNNPVSSDKLNLRASASTGAASIGKYVNGVRVDILATSTGDWVKVQIGIGDGKATGYMMKKFLAMGESGNSVRSVIQYKSVISSSATLRKYASTSAGSLGSYSKGTSVEILGTAGSWYHVRINGSTVGYMLASCFTADSTGSTGGGTSGGDAPWTGGTYSYAVVRNPSSAERLNLRMGPSANTDSIGKYNNGTYVTVLEQTNANWWKVRIGNDQGGAVGYMNVPYLAYGSAANNVTSAMPVYYSNSTAWSLYGSPSTFSNTVANFGYGQAVVVMGIYGSWWHVSVGGYTGYVLGNTSAFRK